MQKNTNTNVNTPITNTTKTYGHTTNHTNGQQLYILKNMAGRMDGRMDGQTNAWMDTCITATTITIRVGTTQPRQPTSQPASERMTWTNYSVIWFERFFCFAFDVPCRFGCKRWSNSGNHQRHIQLLRYQRSALTLSPPTSLQSYIAEEFCEWGDRQTVRHT